MILSLWLIDISLWLDAMSLGTIGWELMHVCFWAYVDWYKPGNGCHESMNYLLGINVCMLLSLWLIDISLRMDAMSLGIISWELMHVFLEAMIYWFKHWNGLIPCYLLAHWVLCHVLLKEGKVLYLTLWMNGTELVFG